MLNYILRRILLIPVTLFGVLLVNFAIVQVAPGGPVQRIMAQAEGLHTQATGRISETAASQSRAGGQTGDGEGGYRGTSGLDPEFVKELKEQFGFDKPPHLRFWHMVKNYVTLDFGESYYRDRSVTALIAEKLPVSISLGAWSTILIYLISVPLGITKAVRDGSRFDVATSGAVVVGYGVPNFLFAILLVVVFAGGRFFDWFPLRGLVSTGWEDLSWPMRVVDYLWHITLPVLAMVVSGFAQLTMLTKNAFLDEIRKQYVVTARAKGLSEHRVLYGHVFRNAMLLVVAGFPSALVSMLFTGSVLIEVIFSLDGIGLLGFEAVVNRDYPVMFGTLFLFTLLGLTLNLVSDLTYHLVDPRIDFESREV